MGEQADLSTYLKIAEWFRAHSALAWAIVITSGVALAVSQYFAWVPVWVKSVFLLVFVFGGAITVAETGQSIFRRRRKKQRLHMLSASEVGVFRRFIDSGSFDCNFMTFENGVDTLEQAGLLSVRLVADSSARDGGVRVCSIEPWVFDEAKKVLGN